MVDQVFSSLSNVALSIGAARMLPTREFGVFALIFAAYTLAIGGARALTSEPLVIGFGGGERDAWRVACRQAGGFAALGGVLAGSILVALAAVLRGGDASYALALVGVSLPLLLVQDFARFAAFAAHRPKSACVNDLVWVGLLAVALGVGLLLAKPSLIYFVASWAASGAVAGAVSITYLRIAPNVRDAVSWWRTQRTLATRFLGEWAVMNGSSQVATYLVAAVASITVVAALRGAQVVLGPFNILLLGVRPLAILEGVQLRDQRPRALVLFMGAVSGALAVSALVLGVLIDLLPGRFGFALLGSTWHAAHPVVLLTAIGLAGGGASAGGVIGLRVRAAASQSLRARCAVVGLTFCGTVAGALLDGAVGAAAGIAIASWLGAGIWWSAYLSTGPESLRSRGGLKRVKSAAGAAERSYGA